MLDDVFDALRHAAHEVYGALQVEHGMRALGKANATGDDQLALDVFADEAFLKQLSACPGVRYAVSEERPDLVRVQDGPFSVALDPLDGSKSALVGIPSGAIFCIFRDAGTVSDFVGKNIVASGFFVFGLNLEMFFADDTGVHRGLFDQRSGTWSYNDLPKSLPQSDFFAVNASNWYFWEPWLQDHYNGLIHVSGDQQPHNLRWYASMVSEVKRLILEGGVFSYPADRRPGYQDGRLRLVYEALPMAFLVERMGGLSSDGDRSLLRAEVTRLHQKVPVFLGEAAKIRALEDAKRNG